MTTRESKPKFKKIDFTKFEIRCAAANHKTARRNSNFTDVYCTDNHIPKVITPGLAASIKLPSNRIKDSKKKTANCEIGAETETEIKSSGNDANLESNFEGNFYSISFENDGENEVFRSEISGSSVRDLLRYFENCFESEHEKRSNDKFRKKSKCASFDTSGVVSSEKEKCPGSSTTFNKMNESVKCRNVPVKNTMLSPSKRTLQVAAPSNLELPSATESSCKYCLRRQGFRSRDLRGKSKPVYTREHVFIFSENTRKKSNRGLNGLRIRSRLTRGYMNTLVQDQLAEMLTSKPLETSADSTKRKESCEATVQIASYCLQEKLNSSKDKLSHILCRICNADKFIKGSSQLVCRFQERNDLWIQKTSILMVFVVLTVFAAFVVMRHAF